MTASALFTAEAQCSAVRPAGRPVTLHHLLLLCPVTYNIVLFRAQCPVSDNIASFRAQCPVTNNTVSVL